MKKLLSLALLSLLASCELFSNSSGIATSIPNATGLNPIPTFTPTVTNTLENPATVETPRPTSSPIVTPYYHGIEFGFSSYEELLKDWHLFDPHDLAIGDLLLRTAEGFQLDPEWKIQKLEYSYEWWGLSDPMIDYQLIELKEGQYFKNTEPIDELLVRNFLSSISNFEPVQFELAALDHTDDYPYWMVELTGEDDRHLILFSSSTANPGSAPWNVLDNGRLYSQSYGQIRTALDNLFPGPSGEPAASFYPGDRDPDSFLLATSGLPSQLSEGFVGLLQISHGFFYQPLPKQNAIHGFIIGRSSIGGYGFMVIGTINSLQSIVLLPHDRNPITCTFEGITSEDPSAAAWDFECPINFLQPGQKFSLPIRIEFSTTDGTNHSTRGILIGEWMEGNRQLFLPPPTSLMEVINSYEPAVQILKSHPLTQLEYVGVISAGEKDTYIGEAILLGKARVDGQTLRYSIGTPFIIENGEVKHWALTYETLTQLIADVMQQPFIQRAVEVIPDLGIKLWYAEKVESPEMPTIFNANLSMHFFAEIGHCGKTPLTKLPSDGSPLRGFSLEVGRFRGDPQFVLLPDGLFVHELDLRPAEDAQNPILPLLVPPELDTGDNAPFERIWFQGKSFFQDQPELTLWAPKNINPIITSPYRELIESLPFILKESTKGVLGAKYVTLVFTENGTSKLVACSTR